MISLSKKEHAWFCLRGSVASNLSSQKRWHMDGSHYRSKDIQYKFCFTIQGEPTLFYLLPRESMRLRQVIWRNMNDTQFTNEFCHKDLIYKIEKREGVLFMIGNSNLAAFHSEPETTTPRLFFSIVPCEENQLKEIRERLYMYYPPSEQQIYIQG